MSGNFMTAVLAGVFAVSGSLAAQTPSTTQSSTQAPVTVEGCLMREADVPGRRPNVAERVGIGEDYILTNAKMVKGSAPTARIGNQAGETQRGASPQATMYEIEGIDDDVLQQHVGRRVQVEGAFEHVDRAVERPDPDRPADDLVELSATTIRQAGGACSAS